MQNIANQLPDAFTDLKRVTKSHIPAINAPAHIDVPIGQSINEITTHLKRGRPISSKDKNPRKRKGATNQDVHFEAPKSHIETTDITFDKTPEDVQIFDREEIESIKISYRQ